jgi:hypothetical protein
MEYVSKNRNLYTYQKFKIQSENAAKLLGKIFCWHNKTNVDTCQFRYEWCKKIYLVIVGCCSCILDNCY